MSAATGAAGAAAAAPLVGFGHFGELVTALQAASPRIAPVSTTTTPRCGPVDASDGDGFLAAVPELDIGGAGSAAWISLQDDDGDVPSPDGSSSSLDDETRVARSNSVDRAATSPRNSFMRHHRGRTRSKSGKK
jgi:hypothetical protein